MSDRIYLTKEELNKIIQELKYLKSIGRSKIAKDISDAREKGDLSENAEYHAAKEAQAHHEMKIFSLEKKIRNIKIIDTDKIDYSKVCITSQVTIMNLDNKKCMTYRIVSDNSIDTKKNTISFKSPIGKNILHKKVNDIVNVNTPSGILKFKILSISK
ncbi:MAG: transcription elongation factor GreA [Bacteroides sp.]|nr:MAG: transcription elongation factor GreA [Bacteroides sp.]